MKRVMPGHVIGIVGGNHQGRLLALAAKNLGLKVALLDPDKYCPAADLSDWHVLADYTDDMGMLNLAEKADLMTFTSQKTSRDAVEKLRDIIPIPQSSELLDLVDNRLLLKSYFEESNINIAPYHVIGESADLDLAIDAIGLPAVLKPIASPLGKKRIQVIKNLSDIRDSIDLLASGPCLLESFIDCDATISVTVAGNGSGTFEVFPVVANQYNGTGDYQGTIVPAPIELDVTVEAKRLAEQLALNLKLRGVMTVEMFVSNFGIIYVNSISHGPQPVGDYTLNVGQYSQYEAHLRGLLEWPLPPFHLTSRCVTVPIHQYQLADCVAMIKETSHWFYHFDRLTERKSEDVVGHLAIVTDDITAALNELNKTEIWDDMLPIQGGN